MLPAANTLLPLVIVALGILGIILSFMVPDRKKSLISLGLAALIIVVGVVQLGSQSIQRWRWDRRIRDMQRVQQEDFEKLRQKMNDKTAQPAAVAPAQGAKKK